MACLHVILTHVGRELRSLQDQAGVHAMVSEVSCFIDKRFVRDHAACLDTAGSSDDDARLSIVDAHRKFRRGEAAKNDGVDRT